MKYNEAKKPFMYLRILKTAFSFDQYLSGDPLSLLPNCIPVKTSLEHHEYSTDGFIEREYIMMALSPYLWSCVCEF